MDILSNQLPPNAHACFSEQAKLTPHAVAVRYQKRSYSYSALEEQSTRVAHYFVEKGLAKGVVAGVCLPPSMDLVVCMLAVWKVGGVYLPLEPDFPSDRLLEIVDEAGCGLVITLAPLSYPFQRPGTCVVYFDAEREWFSLKPTEPLPVKHRSEDLAYLMYTSGSTGKPKGVMVSHKALVNKLMVPGTWGEVTADCRSALLTSIAFDPSLIQIMLPLAHGGSVLVVDASDRLKPSIVWKLLREMGINILDCTPSWLQAMLSSPVGGFLPDRIVLGGEVLTPAFARRVHEIFGLSKIVNIYGPTEACVDATAHELEPEDFDVASIPIGRALPGYQLRIVSEDGQPVVMGEVGELYIGGVGLAEGYWRNSIATGESFVIDSEHRSERWYRTGDLVREREDGCIEYLRRLDNQIKLRGQRVELGEIEGALAQLANVKSAIVKAWPLERGFDNQIVAYVVSQNDLSIEQAETFRKELSTKLSRRFPSFMVPAVIEFLDELPLSNTGKIDRSALPKPEKTISSLSEADLPRDEIEFALLKIWKDLLDLEQLGIHDIFFEVGGDSLIAVQLLSVVNNQFATDLPFTTFLTHPSIADFAIALTRGMQAINVERSNMRVMRIGTKPEDVAPLFLLPPRSGVGLVYIGIARELSGVIPTVALQTVDMPNECPGDIDMNRLVAELVKEVELIQSNGPLRLCGYSAGGPLAFEMARHFEEKGRDVSHLILIDPFCADYSDWPDIEPIEDSIEVFWGVCRDMIADATGMRGVSADPLFDVTKRLWLEVLSVGARLDDPAIQTLLGDVDQVLPEHISLEVFLMLLEGAGNLWYASERHSLKPLPDVAEQSWFIQPDEDPEDFRSQRADFWQRLVGKDMQRVLVPGEHITMMNRSRSVSAIGAHLRSILGRDR